jgi:formate dehydrogenase iron-sulfur subunit
MSLRVFVPRDAAAIACGADAVAEELVAAAEAVGVEIALVRNVSRGMLWLEPLVEVTGADGRRYGFGPVASADVGALVGAGLFVDPARVAHPLAVGAIERHPSSPARRG